MDDPRVLCVGELLWDCLADNVGRSLAEVESWTRFPGGAPANVACGLSALGTPSAFIGCVGADAAGKELLEMLRSRGVDTAGVQIHPSAPTRQVYVTRSSMGERTFAGFGDRPTTTFADAFLDASHLLERLFARADYLAIGTLGFAYPHTRVALERSLNLARMYGVSVAIDLNWRPVFWPEPETAAPLVHQILPQADYLKCADEEARWLFGTDSPTCIAKRLPHLRGVLVTLGDRGCTYACGGHSGYVPAFALNTVDTTGAGDSFLAGFLHQLGQLKAGKRANSPETVRHAIQFACAAGALTTTRLGAIAAQPSAAEVRALLAERDITV